MSARVLVVEESVDAARRLEKLLLEYGYDVRTVASGPAALKEMARRPCEVVLANVQSRGFDVGGLVKELRAVNPDVQVVLTGSADGPDGYLSGGFMDVVHDSLNPDALLRRLARTTTPRPGRKSVVLLVDDNPEEVDGLADALAAGGYEVLRAISGEEAIATARVRRIDTAVLDVRMPGISGWETFLALKALQPELNAVMVSGCGVEEYLEECLQENRVPLVAKAFDPKEMFRLVSGYLKPARPVVPPRILVVDDDPGYRSFMVRGLERAGYRVEEADTARAALFQAESGGFDAVVLDCLLPDMPGLEVAKALHRLLPDAKFIVTTAQPEVDGVMEALQLRVHEYIPKSASSEPLVKSLQQALKEARLERQSRDLLRDLHEANRQLEDLHRLKSKLLFLTVHHIRSPLTSALGFAALLQERKDLPADVHRDLDFILDGLKRADRVMEDFVDLGRMDAGRFSFRMGWIKAADFFRELQAREEKEFNRQGVTLEWDVARAPSAIKADPFRLDQACNILLRMALRQGDKVKRARFRAWQEEETLFLELSHDGPGPSAEALAGPSSSHGMDEPLGEPDTRGIAVGLSILRELAAGHGGTVETGGGQESWCAYRLRIPAHDGPPA